MKRALSVKYEKTISGGASMRCVISMNPAAPSSIASPPRACLGFGELLQPAELGQPHLPQHRFEWAQRLVVGAVEAMGSRAPFGDQPRAFEDAQVLGDGGPADVRGGGDFARGALRIPHQPQDL